MHCNTRQLLFAGLLTAAMALGAKPVLAQSYEITLAANQGNGARCLEGDRIWAKKWSALVTGDSTVVKGTKLTFTLPKISDGIYENTFSSVGSGFSSKIAFTFTFNANEPSFAVRSKSNGCAWEGKANKNG